MGCPHSRRVWLGSICGTRRDPSPNAFPQDGRKILNSDTFLLHRIAIAECDCFSQRRIFFAKRLEINGHTEGRADFVLPSVSPTNRSALVVKHSHVRAQKRDDLFRFRDERLLIFEQRQNCTLDWRDPWMESQHYPRFHFALVVRRLIFCVCVADQSEDGAIHARAWFDNMRDESLLRLVVEILERLTTAFLMLQQIVIGPVRNPFELLPTKR